MFVDPSAKVAVTLGENTVYVRAKMSAGTKALLEDEIKTGGSVRRSDGGEVVDEAEMSGFGTYAMLLRVHNIVAWDGPDFVDDEGKPIPCTRTNIMRMDPTTELYELVGDRIGELNKKAGSPDPN